MALIIKGDMPKACNWFDENGKHRFCKINAFCDCRIYSRGKRPSDCPILGEIPDKHGRLIDANVAYDKIAEQEGGNYVDMDAVDLGLQETPTILEATE